MLLQYILIAILIYILFAMTFLLANVFLQLNSLSNVTNIVVLVNNYIQSKFNKFKSLDKINIDFFLKLILFILLSFLVVYLCSFLLHMNSRNIANNDNSVTEENGFFSFIKKYSTVAVISKNKKSSLPFISTLYASNHKKSLINLITDDDKNEQELFLSKLSALRKISFSSPKQSYQTNLVYSLFDFRNTSMLLRTHTNYAYNKDIIYTINDSFNMMLFDISSMPSQSGMRFSGKMLPLEERNPLIEDALNYMTSINTGATAKFVYSFS